MRAYPRHIISLRPEVFTSLITSLFTKKILSGPEISEFEKSFSDYIEVKFAIGVAQARLGLIAIFKILGLKAGDEIIVSSFNFHIIPEIITKLKLVPVFVDIDPTAYNINAHLIREKISTKTKVILVTHMFGQPADMDDILSIAKENNLRVIEDCAHALGAEYNGKKVGSMGDAAIFSFSMGKNMCCFGGGAITTNDEELYRELKRYIYMSKFPPPKIILTNILKFSVTYLLTSTPLFSVCVFPLIRIMNRFNKDPMELGKKESICPAVINNLDKQPLRLTNIQAIIGIKQLKLVDIFNNKRFENSKMISGELDNYNGIYLPKILPNQKPIFLYYMIRVKENKDTLRKQLFRKKIDSSSRSSMSTCANIDSEGLKKKDYFLSPIENNLIQIPNNHLLNKEDIVYISKAIKTALPFYKQDF